MTNQLTTYEEAIAENEELRARLEEAEAVIRAIQTGEVDAVVVSGPQGEQVYTLSGAERTYRILVEAMNEGALVLSPEGLVIYANRTFAAMLGSPIYDLLGRSIYGFVADEDVEPLKRMLERAHLHPGRREICLKRSDTSSVPAFVSVANLATDDGPNVSAVITDLTEHKRTEAELQVYREHLEELVVERTKELIESEQRVVNIIESISDGFMAFDRDWRYVYLNDEGERQIYELTGLTREDVIGRVVWEVLPHMIDTQVYKEYRRAVAEQVSTKFQLYFENTDKWFEIRAFPSEDGLSVYTEDITDRKRTEEALRESEDRARQPLAEIEAI